MPNMRQFKSWGRVATFGLLLGSLSACDDLLQVDLPHVLTDAALEGPETASTQVASAIAQFECGKSTFGFVGLGHEDILGSIAGIGGGNAIYRSTPDTGGGCDTSPSNGNWFDQIMGARNFLSNNKPKGDLEGSGVYDRLQNDPTWADIDPALARVLSATSAIYMGGIMAHFGEFYCEIGFDGSDVLTPAAVLAMGESWIDTALGHIGGTDFAMLYGVSTSAINTAMALRARLRWAQGNLAGAAADAATIPTGFTAWITRETGEQRRNKVFNAAQSVSFAGMYGIIDWWQSSVRRPNPATGLQWPDTIPYTGYIFLGIMPDGRVTESTGTTTLPIRWAEELRDTAVANFDVPIPSGNGSTADTRVPHGIKSVQGPGRFEVPNVYSTESDDLPWVSWEEMRFIQAENANANGTFPTAVAFVNEIRTDRGLPTVTYAPATTADVRSLIIEERRRTFFANGGARYWSTKIQNTDLLWFPRREGDSPLQSFSPLSGGVRLEFPADEYTNNELWADRGGLDLRGTICDAAEAPQIT